jgi:hypothetical protein
MGSLVFILQNWWWHWSYCAVLWYQWKTELE